MPVRSLQLLVAAASLAVATVYSWLLLNPAHDPYRTGQWMGIGGQLPTGVGVGAVAVIALLGAVAAVALRPGRLLVVVAAVEAAVLALLTPDTSLLAILGYLCALVLPLGGVVALAVAARRIPVLGLVAAVIVVGGAVWGTSTGALDPDALGRLGANLLDGFARMGSRPWLLLGAGATGALWVWLLLRTQGGEALAAFARRWGRVATLVASACLVPYVVLRMTWLTPWLVGGPGPEQDLSPEIRLWGLLLGLAALVGSVLTMGLISSWGERFPRWIPGLSGRRVPIAAAAGPAGLVSGFVMMASPSMVAQAWASGEPEFLLVFPFPVWGPTLAVASVAYVLRRRSDETAGVDDRRELSAAG